MAGASPAAPRREEALAFIIHRLAATGSAPSYDEIGQGMRPPVQKTRARQLVAELIALGIIEKTPGAQRALRIRDVAMAREIVAVFLGSLGWPVATPMGILQQPFQQASVPMLPPFRHLPDADHRGPS